MPQYLVIHDVIQYPESQDEWITIWKELRAQACGDLAWLHSFFEPSTGKLYCEWEAPSPEEILDCLSKEVLDLAPVASISEVVLFDVKWLNGDA
jgi:hypothetical protein